MISEQLPPDWVMLGAPIPDGVMLVASNELTAAEIQAEWEEPDRYNFGGARRWSPELRHLRLTADMRCYHVVHASDYREAFAKLFETWQPSATSAEQIAPPVRALAAPPASGSEPDQAR